MATPVSTTNWVERRALLENNARDGAGALWNSVSHAIHDCCKTFNTHYSRLATVEVGTRGHQVSVKVSRPDPVPTGSQRMLSIEFDGNQSITVQTGQGTPKLFEIVADETHAYIRYDEREISPDECSRLALEDVFFPKPRTA